MTKLPELRTQYLAYNCIKSQFTELDFISFIENDENLVFTIKITPRNSESVTMPLFVRKYKEKIAIKEFAFSDAIERIKMFRVLGRIQEDALNSTVSIVHKKCFLYR